MSALELLMDGREQGQLVRPGEVAGAAAEYGCATALTGWRRPGAHAPASEPHGPANEADPR
jgi:hypothetical protein